MPFLESGITMVAGQNRKMKVSHILTYLGNDTS